MNADITPSKKRLLVIKHGALGDMVQGFAAFASLRHGHPDAHIALLTTPPFASLAAKMPWFDEVLIDRRAGLLNIFEGLRMRKLLRADWDWIVDMQCSGRTARYFTFFARADVRWVGTAKNCSDPCPDFTGVNNQQRMCVVAAMAGGSSASVDMRWLLETSAKPLTGNDAQPYAILIPGCSAAKPRKRWPAVNFAALAKALRAKGLAVVLVGTAADRSAIDEVLHNAPDCIDLCGKTSLAELAGLCASARLAVGNDTGPVFLAAASGAPTLMVMGPDTDPGMSAPTGAQCDWIQGRPITKVSVDDVVGRLAKLTKI